MNNVENKLCPQYLPHRSQKIVILKGRKFNIHLYLVLLVWLNIICIECGVPTARPTTRPTARPTPQPTTRPTPQPTSQPTPNPSRFPSLNPSAQPNSSPTKQPSLNPTSSPTLQPYTIPSRTPTNMPSRSPSVNPTFQPSCSPSVSPSSLPSSLPTRSPTTTPSKQPTKKPSSQPTFSPSKCPSNQPTGVPTSAPSKVPSQNPTVNPSKQPTIQPSSQPSHYPTSNPIASPTLQPTYSPSRSPTSTPTLQPRGLPSVGPTSDPSIQPTNQPIAKPSPSHTPSLIPSCQPTRIPSSHPSLQPTYNPSKQPSSKPTTAPSNLPSLQPSCSPSKQPSTKPTNTPTSIPSSNPSSFPSELPTIQPTVVPSRQPSNFPSANPTQSPSAFPSTQPTSFPTISPTITPTINPSRQPTVQPSTNPSHQPSSVPSGSPSVQPSNIPSQQPSLHPSVFPSSQPTHAPSNQPSNQPTIQPSVNPSSNPSSDPSIQPSENPTRSPTNYPSIQPTSSPSSNPSNQPSNQPSKLPSTQPSISPSDNPTSLPSHSPSSAPTSSPTFSPSQQPSVSPTVQPTNQPTSNPTVQPTELPSTSPTTTPSKNPSNQPSTYPSNQPTFQPSIFPSGQPSMLPSQTPTSSPSIKPSLQPSSQPSWGPTSQPSLLPSMQPTLHPSSQPSSYPSVQPSTIPSDCPSSIPSQQPSGNPTSTPSLQPSHNPSSFPSNVPSSLPSTQPTNQPSFEPSSQPTAIPSILPSKQPTKLPTNNPTLSPTANPSQNPSSFPSTIPTCQPSSNPTMIPSTQPSTHPTLSPSSKPTVGPSVYPSNQPSASPTSRPSVLPSSNPSNHPSSHPSYNPTIQPSNHPSISPTCLPTNQPSNKPSNSPTNSPSSSPSAQPTCHPSLIPSIQPSIDPSSSPSIIPSCSPSIQPSESPLTSPTSRPSSLPTSMPTTCPTNQPTSSPSQIPSSQPSTHPTTQPTTPPTKQPSSQPSLNPSNQPTVHPSFQPTIQPTNHPSCQPSVQPTNPPTSQPTSEPSLQPTIQPTTAPSTQPTHQPDSPSIQPSVNPSCSPTTNPTSQPTMSPSLCPTQQPSNFPSSQPSLLPTDKPSCNPTCQPSSSPTNHPSHQPTEQPSLQPTSIPTNAPTSQPSESPSSSPSNSPTTVPSHQPSEQPSKKPTSQPSVIPSSSPTSFPTSPPTDSPSLQPSSQPSHHPTKQPSASPTSSPSVLPSSTPTVPPTSQPSVIPSATPSKCPTSQPTVGPSNQPTALPSKSPSIQPSNTPTSNPSNLPSITPSIQPSNNPSKQPSNHPSAQPSNNPTANPTQQPTSQPSDQPTQAPSNQPSGNPSVNPTNRPSYQPSSKPSMMPSEGPSSNPSSSPSIQPSSAPTGIPTKQPTSNPSFFPSSQPTTSPSNLPTQSPSNSPSSNPSSQPSNSPSSSPTIQPSMQPSLNPTIQPTSFPSTNPSSQPTDMPTMGPTRQPSMQPTIGETNKPSNFPTSSPTWNIKNFHQHFTYATFTATNTIYSSIPNSFTFGSYFYKEQVVQGNDDYWNDFIYSSLSLPDESIIFTSLNTTFLNYDFSTQTTSSLMAICSDRSIVSSLIGNLQSGNYYSAYCNYNTWRVFSCNGRNILCVNCKHKCVDTVTCPGKSFIFNPNENCLNRLAASAIVNVGYTSVALYPNLLTPLEIASIGNDFVTVKANLSSEGNIFCAAVTDMSKLKSLSYIGSYGSRNISMDTGIVHITISQLYPLTQYSVVCYTDDFRDNLMPLDKAISSNLSITTLCCKRIRFIDTPRIIYEYDVSSTESIFTVSLNSFPTTKSILLLQLNKEICSSAVSTSSNSIGSIIPSKFVFYSNSSSLSASFVVRSSVGCYSLVAHTRGLDNYLNDSIRLNIISSSSIPDPPILLNATLGEDALSISVIFDIETNLAAGAVDTFYSNFNCSELIIFVSSSSANCIWTSAKQLMVYLSQSTVNPGDRLTLLPRKIKRACSGKQCGKFSFSAKMVVAISYPINNINIAASLLGPRYVSSCSDIVLDPTLSQGSLGRIWNKINWYVTSSGFGFGDDTDNNITSYLTSKYNDTTSTISIPSQMLSSGKTYLFSMKLTNWLLQTAIARVKVTVSSSPIIPTLYLFSLNSVFNHSQEIEVFASVTYSGCNINSSSQTLEYNWKVYEGVVQMRTIKSSSLNPNFLKLPANTLNASTLYRVELSLNVLMNNRVVGRTSKSFLLQIGRQGVVASVYGGKFQSFATNSLISLDASPSYDVDYPLLNALDYSWYCVMTYPRFGSKCPKFVNSNNEILSFLAVNYTANYTISLTVSSFDGYSASQEYLISVVNGSLPIVSIATTSFVVNTEEKLIVTGTIEGNEGNVQAEWSLLNIARLKLSSISATPSKQYLPSGKSIIQLSVLEYSLTPGIMYQFMLKASYGHPSSVAVRAYAFAVIEIIINDPPSGGYLDVSPVQGIAVETVFTLSAPRWSDSSSNYPLKYSFGYFVSNDLSDFIIVRNADLRTSFSSLFGPGLLSNKYRISTVVVVNDSLGSASNSTFNIIVQPKNISSSIINTLNKTLQFYTTQFDSSSIGQTINAAVESINRVNCSVSISCYVLNRYECSQTPATCGECMTGFNGVIGDSNLPCYSSLKVLLSIGSSCSTNSNCSTGVCKNRVCQESYKSCPNQCSGKGTCSFVDTSNNIISTCQTSNFFCIAKCNCANGWFGADCSLSQSQYVTQRVLREQLCYYAYQTLSFQDITSDVMYSRASTVNQLLSDMSQITTKAYSFCTRTLLLSINMDASTACQSRNSRIVYDALSTVLQRERIPSSLRNNISNTLSSLSVGCQENLAFGEQMSIATSTVKVLTVVHNKYSLSVSNTLSVPISAYEKSNGINPPLVKLLNNSLTGSENIGLSTAQYSQVSNGSILNSSAVEIQTTNYLSTGNTRRVLSNVAAARLNYSVTLQNKNPIEYSMLAINHTTADCFLLSDNPYNITYSCNGVDASSITCPAGRKGSFNITCAGFDTIAVCLIWDGYYYAPTNGCYAQSHTPTNTTCVCEDGLSQIMQTSSKIIERGSIASSIKIIRTTVSSDFNALPFASSSSSNLLLGAVVSIYGLAAVVLGTWVVSSSKVDKKIAPLATSSTQRTITSFFSSIIPAEFNTSLAVHNLFTGIMIDHGWFKSDSYGNKQYIMIPFILSKIISFVFYVTLVTVIINLDNGQCESVSEEMSCKSHRSMFELRHDCDWNDDLQFCRFQPFPYEVYNIFFLTCIIILFSFLTNKILENCIMICLKMLNHSRVKKHVDISSPILDDEFNSFQTIRGKYLRGAKLIKLQKFDFMNQSEEAEVIASSKKLSTAEKLGFIPAGANYFECYHSRYELMMMPWTSQTAKIILKIQRIHSEKLIKMIASTHNNQEKESILMLDFIIELLPTYLHRFTRELFYRHRHYNTNKTPHIIIIICAILYIISHVAGMTFYIFKYGLILGKRSMPIWWIVLLLSFGIDMLIIQSFKLYFKYVILFHNIILPLLQSNLNWVKRRARLILTRSSGLLLRHTLLQHYNPACRVARQLLHSPISHLLISMIDEDISMISQNEKKKLLYPDLERDLLVIDWKLLLWLPSTIISILNEMIFSIISLLMIYGLIALFLKDLIGFIIVIILIISALVTPLLWQVWVAYRQSINEQQDAYNEELNEFSLSSRQDDSVEVPLKFTSALQNLRQKRKSMSLQLKPGYLSMPPRHRHYLNVKPSSVYAASDMFEAKESPMQQMSLPFNVKLTDTELGSNGFDGFTDIKNIATTDDNYDYLAYNELFGSPPSPSFQQKQPIAASGDTLDITNNQTKTRKLKVRKSRPGVATLQWPMMSGIIPRPDNMNDTNAKYRLQEVTLRQRKRLMRSQNYRENIREPGEGSGMEVNDHNQHDSSREFNMMVFNYYADASPLPTIDILANVDETGLHRRVNHHSYRTSRINNRSNRSKATSKPARPGVNPSGPGYSNVQLSIEEAHIGMTGNNNRMKVLLPPINTNTLG
eukprot:gene4991-6977_t